MLKEGGGGGREAKKWFDGRWKGLRDEGKGWRRECVKMTRWERGSQPAGPSLYRLHLSKKLTLPRNFLFFFYYSLFLRNLCIKNGKVFMAEFCNNSLINQ